MRIDTLILKQIQHLTHPTPGGFRGLYIVKNLLRRIRTQIWHACADRYSHLKNVFDLPHPRGFRGLSIVKHLLRRTAPKFGTHVRIDTLTLKTITNLTHPTPGGLGGYLLLKNLSRRTAPKFGTHVRIDTLTLKNKIAPPHCC